MTEAVVEGASNSNSILDFFLTNPIGMFIVAIIIFAVLVYVFNKSTKDKWFKPVPLKTILKDQNQKLLKATMIRGYWGYIRRGDISLGKILRIGKLNYITKNINYVKPKKKGYSKEEWAEVIKKSEHQKHIEKEFYIIKISTNPQALIIAPFIWILEAFNIGVHFAIVPTEHTHRSTIEGVGFSKRNVDYINIDPKIQVISLANVFVYGFYAFELWKDITLFYQREMEQEELVNYPKRVVYLDSQHAKKTDSYEEMDRLERSRFDSKIKRMTGGK